MMKFKIFLICWMAFDSLAAQITQYGDLELFSDSLLAQMPGSSGNDYVPPSSGELQTWENAMQNLLQEDYSAASDSLNVLGYQLHHFHDTTASVIREYYIAVQQNGSAGYRGSYFFKPDACRDKLVLQSPHPLYDTNTGKQGVYIFKRLDNAAFFMSGTHRCNHDSLSFCSGTTSSCGSSGSYPVSDMAHNASTFFQRATKVLFNHITQPRFMQLHGFGKQSTDPYVILSNGSRDTPNPDYLLDFKNHLSAQDTALTFKVAHTDTNWTRLIGFTNVQGRWINGLADPCTQYADATTGRFIHYEQEKSRLRDDAAKWQKTLYALQQTFACQMSGKAEVQKEQYFSVSPNPFSHGFTLTIEKPVRGESRKLSLFDMKGQIIAAYNISSEKRFISCSHLKKGVYFAVLETSKKRYIRKLVCIHE